MVTFKPYIHTLIMFVFLCLCTQSFAQLTDPTLVFKMTSDKTSLLPGEETTVHIWAWIFTTAGIEKPSNGLDTWQIDLSVNQANVVQITSLSVLAPNPNPSWPAYQASSLNSPSGEVHQVAATQLYIGADSLTGVGTDNNIDNASNYSEICRFNIQALQNPEASTVTYSVMNKGGGWFGYLASGDLFDNSDISAIGGTYFYASGSNNVFTIVPEPATLLLFTIGAAFSLRRRK